MIRIRYRDNLMPVEEAALLAEVEALDKAYCESEQWHDLRAGPPPETGDDGEDQMELWRRAALDRSGRT